MITHVSISLSLFESQRINILRIWPLIIYFRALRVSDKTLNPRAFNSERFTMAKKPRLIVFDLDYTLWPFYVDCSVTPPFRKAGHGEIVDSRQRTINCYKDVPFILETLYSSGYQLAIASRTGEIDGANQLITLFGWDKFFTYKEIYPGCKKAHFTRFHELSGIDYKDMLFFDDENRNITDIRSLGVTCVWVENGMNKSLLEQGLKRFHG